jgi:hypothetical protein
MKNKCLIVLATVAIMVIGLGSLASVKGSEIVASVHGNTVVQDSKSDLLLRNCDPNHPGIPCSLPPGAPLYLPGYFDIKTAKITQIGAGRVDLSIKVYEPIPAEPPYPFVNYYWQFEGGCVKPEPGNKAGISIIWNVDVGEWRAHWYEITSCSPPKTELAGPVPFEFTGDGVKVRVALDDLLTAMDEGEPLVWFAGVRRVPFIYKLDGVQIRTNAVDYAPDVVAFLPPPDYITYPEDPATWEPR